MKINRDNYMLFFLDYYEDKLPESSRGELMRFLDDHPDLKVEFYDFDLIRLPADKHLKFPGKASLKKQEEAFDAQEAGRERSPAGPDHYDELFAAYAEGDLDAEAQAEALAAPGTSLERELKLMSAARLRPDASISYPHKSGLKRHGLDVFRQRFMPYASAAAAVLLLAVLTYTLFVPAGSPYYAEEQPVAGDQDAPGAVAAIPDPQQERPAALTEAESITGALPGTGADAARELPAVTRRPAIAQLDPAGEGRTAMPAETISGSPIALDITAFRRVPEAREPLLAMQMEARQPEKIPAAAQTTSPEAREEFIWLAYQAPEDRQLPLEEEEPATGYREMNLAELAMNRIGETTGIRLDNVRANAGSDESPLRYLAEEGVARIIPATGRVLGIESARDDKGRLLHFSIGDFFSITRTSKSRDL